MDSEANHLWERYRKGDQRAFEQLYYQQVSGLYDYGRRMTKDTALVEDCMQDLFSYLWEKRRTIKPVASVKSYLLVALKRRVIRKLSQARNNKSLPLPLTTDLLPGFTPIILEDATDERLACLTQAFARLSDKQKEVIYLRFYNQLSYEEIAEVMSVQVKATYKLMARAIRVLRVHSRIPTPLLLVIVFLICLTFY